MASPYAILSSYFSSCCRRLIGNRFRSDSVVSRQNNNNDDDDGDNEVEDVDATIEQHARDTLNKRLELVCIAPVTYAGLLLDADAVQMAAVYNEQAPSLPVLLARTHMHRLFGAMAEHYEDAIAHVASVRDALHAAVTACDAATANDAVVPEAAQKCARDKFNRIGSRIVLKKEHRDAIYRR